MSPFIPEDLKIIFSGTLKFVDIGGRAYFRFVAIKLMTKIDAVINVHRDRVTKPKGVFGNIQGMAANIT